MNVDDASQESDESSVIILAQLSDEPIEPTKQPINKDFVLLDSQSTVNLFSNPCHVRNICPADMPIRVQCNKGTMITTKQADFGDNPVYFDANGIANVLSLFWLAKKYCITMTVVIVMASFASSPIKAWLSFCPLKRVFTL
jgi:hypothetical protein